MLGFRYRKNGAPGDPEIEQWLQACVWAEAPSGDVVLLHVPAGTYVRLEGSAPVIVDLLVQHGSCARAAGALAERYGISLERASADVAAVVATIEGLRATRRSFPRRPTVAGALAEVRRWWRLPVRLRLDAVQACGVVLCVEAGLHTMDLERLARMAGVPMAAGAHLGEPSEDPWARLTDREQRIYLAANWVLDRWIYDGTCLRRALVTGHFLRKRGPRLHLGLAGDGSTSHAWIEAQGMVFNSEPVSAPYVRLDAASHG
jgi:Transglutaminase-like superfamily/Coenzyme PQQ synthesis protein D (PqqD)